MDVINEVEILEDIEEVKTKCDKIQCNPIFDAFYAVIKLFKDFFKCIITKIKIFKNKK